MAADEDIPVCEGIGRDGLPGRKLEWIFTRYSTREPPTGRSDKNDLQVLELHRCLSSVPLGYDE
jgi:hypothetical protein